MTTLTTDRAIPNRRARTLLLAFQDVMGRNGLNATLKLAGLQRYIGELPPADAGRELHASEYATLLRAVESQLGSGARGQLNRIGQAAFRQTLAAEVWAWRQIAALNAILPAQQRIRRALGQLAHTLAAPDGRVEIQVEEGQLRLVDFSSDGTHGRTRPGEICWLTLGEIQECVHWATGHPYEVTETDCKAKGAAACVFVIGPRLS